MIETRYVGRCDECGVRHEDTFDYEQALIDVLIEEGWLVDLTILRVCCPSCRKKREATAGG